MSEQEIRKILAAKLKEYRELNGLTIKEVGDYIGKSEKTVSAWEHERGQPDADMLFTLCALYHIDNIGVFYGADSSTSHTPITPDETELLGLYRSVIPVGQEHIMSTARMVAGNPDMQKDAPIHRGAAI